MFFLSFQHYVNSTDRYSLVQYIYQVPEGFRVAKDPRLIQILELKDTISQLNETIKMLNQSLKASQEREAVMQEQIDYLTKKLFGRSSEKRSVQIEGQMNLFDEAENEADPSAPEPDEMIDVKAHSRKAKAKNKDKYSNLPVREEVLELPESDRVCPQCGGPLKAVGKRLVREEITYIPAKMEIVRYYTTTYKCEPCCEGRTGFDKGVMIRTMVPPPLMPHSPASPSAVAWTMYQKYANAMPLYRQEKDWLAIHGVTITRATLANWIIYCAEHHLKPLYEYFHRELLKRRFLMADETRIQVLKEPERDPETVSFMWLFRTGEDEGPTIIIYKYTQTRAKYNAADFLQGFEGYLETDGYQGYNDLPGVKRCCCWAHVRRDFYDAIPKGKESDLTEPAVQAVEYCDKLFTCERIAREKGLNHDARKEYRLKKEKPVLDSFWEWVEKQHPIKNSRLDKAINYARNRKQHLETYLEDGRCSLSNNLSENAIRPFTVGRKNWLFADTVKGAEASAVCYTMIEMAKAHGLNPYAYLDFVLTNRLDENPSDSDLALLAPWGDLAQEYCKS